MQPLLIVNSVRDLKGDIHVLSKPIVSEFSDRLQGPTVPVKLLHSHAHIHPMTAVLGHFYQWFTQFKGWGFSPPPRLWHVNA